MKNSKKEKQINFLISLGFTKNEINEMLDYENIVTEGHEQKMDEEIERLKLDS